MKSHFYDIICPILLLISTILIYLGMMFQVNSIDLLIGFSLAFLINHFLFWKFLNKEDSTKYAILYSFSLFLAFVLITVSYEFLENFENIAFYSFCFLIGAISVIAENFLVIKKIKRDNNVQEKNTFCIEA
ncbi:MAG: hypothetical protein Q8M44_04265 [bacterium]|nr:hypothetical protein [bacterium]